MQSLISQGGWRGGEWGHLGPESGEVNFMALALLVALCNLGQVPRPVWELSLGICEMKELEPGVLWLWLERFRSLPALAFAGAVLLVVPESQAQSDQRSSGPHFPDGSHQLSYLRRKGIIGRVSRLSHIFQKHAWGYTRVLAVCRRLTESDFQGSG